MIERHGVLSARARILAWIMVILLLAVTVIVLVTARSLLTRVDSQAAVELNHEAQKFHAFAAEQPAATPGGFRTVDELLSAYLAQNLPEETETFFTVIDGTPHLRATTEPMARLDRDASFVARAAATTRPTSGRVQTTAGPAVYTVIPVSVVGDTARGRLVTVEFLAPAYDEAAQTIVTMSAVALAALMLAGVAGWIVAGRVLAPVRDVRETAAAISETDLGRRIEVQGSDDVALLASTFNRMLDRLESAFDGQRRFLDDAGHELRTPITIIRGHLELMGDDPEERAQTLRLVTDELERMSRLVDDLIMLARSERPDFVRPGPVDLTDLVVETLAKSSAIAERRWSLAETGDRMILADGQRLTQALLQLASNAVQHTEDGDAVELGCRVADGRVRLWVRDSGSGIPPEDRERIFDRFTRGPGRTRHQGSGLGLAIVRRIAEAHGGSVVVSSMPGVGSTFTLDLPLRVPRQSPGEEEQER